MARTAIKVKCKRIKKKYIQAISNNKKPMFATKVYNRCRLCGRNKGYLRKFDMCRICFRELAGQGMIMGVTKSSW